jgi:hypothetical protein
MISDVKRKPRRIPFRSRWHMFVPLWPRQIHIQRVGYRRVWLTILQRRWSRSNRVWQYRLPSSARDQ